MSELTKNKACELLRNLSELTPENLEKARDYIQSLLIIQDYKVQHDPEKFYIYTDGSTVTLPGGSKQSGFAYVVVSSKKGIVNKYSETIGNKTSFQTELSCVIKAFEDIDVPEATIFTDCFSIVTGISQIPNWQKNNWKTSDGEGLREKKLWKKLSRLIEQKPKFKVYWVKGHGEDLFNILADNMAKQAAK